MPVRAYLYDSEGTDKEVALTPELIAGLDDRQLLWIDISGLDEIEVRTVAALLSIQRDSVYNLLHPDRRPRLDNYGKYFQLNINVIQEVDGKYNLIALNFLVERNVLVTVHQDEVDFLVHFDDRIKGDSELGKLDAPGFLASLLDWHITSYFRIVEQLEAQMDRLDAQALRPRHGRNLLRELAHARQRVAFIRRTLTPHREVYAAMARPDFHILSETESSAHYALLNDRLERAIEAIENARELLVGSFDMFTTQTTLRTNDVMKVLTLVSVILLPATVIINIAALLMQAPVDPRGDRGFWMMILSILIIALATLFTARWRKWI